MPPHKQQLAVTPTPTMRTAIMCHCTLQVVYECAQGTPFADICDLTDVMEGSIVRAVVRLDQACRELQVTE